MKHYPQERKDAVIAKLSSGISVPALAREEGISAATLYNWRREARNKGTIVAQEDDTPEGWTSADKFNAVLQSAAMNQAELAEFCRSKGLYPEQIQRWKDACQNANNWDAHQNAQLTKQRRRDQAENKALKSELRRKEKALAETAALLVLRKKFNALMENEEA